MAKTVADVMAVLKAAIAKFGVPQRFLTDNAPALNPTRRGMNGVVETWLRSLGAQPISSTPGHPQTQGKSERHHQTSQRWLAAHDLAADLPSLQALLDQLEDAYVPGRTKAVMMAHALGNPFDLRAVLDFCRRHNLWLIEDNCDALGSTYTMPTADGVVTKPTGTWGDLSTQSFYPPHHLTLGEGGAVNIVSKAPFRVIVESFRDWGRDCWCPSGKDNTCNKRFGWQLGTLPEGYDHKYIYSHLGYNLKPLDPQAAIGRVQLKKLPAFVAARRSNWHKLRAGLDDLQDVFEFSLPTHATGWSAGEFSWDSSGCRSEPSWFGFMLIVRESAPFTRTDVARHLESTGIGNRMLFGGNLVRQPVFHELAGRRPGAFRSVGSLAGADTIMNRALFIGVYPGLDDRQIEYVIDQLRAFASSVR